MLHTQLNKKISYSIIFEKHLLLGIPSCRWKSSGKVFENVFNVLKFAFLFMFHCFRMYPEAKLSFEGCCKELKATAGCRETS